ncbi:MAG: hypothetical protein G01um101431_1137 [Parcubacteria group bacterium Gr01-1014_31]|nr:MAG: hypothetical protein G01um101431_1137 [Parcubacteria group bacterium Gr01-1014_31]
MAEQNILLRVKLQSSVLVAASLMVSISAVALSFALGMMAVAGGMVLQERHLVVHMAAGSPVMEKLWEYDYLSRSSYYLASLGEITPDVGMEILAGDTYIVEEFNEGPPLFLSHQGKSINQDFQYRRLSNFNPISIIDWNNDGVNELVQIEYMSSSDGMNALVLTTAHGEMLLRVPVDPQDKYLMHWEPSIADLDRDELQDFILVGRDLSSDPSYRDVVFAVSGAGRVLWEYPVGETDYSSSCTSPAITPDVDSDGWNDIVFVSCDCITTDDTDVDDQIEGFPFTAGPDPGPIIIVGDNVRRRPIDGRPYCGTAVFRLDHDGQRIWRRFVNDVEQKTSGYMPQLAAADFFRDASMEIVATPGSETKSWLVLLENDGDIIWQKEGWGRRYGVGLLLQAVGDVVTSVNDTPEIITSFYEDHEDSEPPRVEIFDVHGILLNDLHVDQAWYGQSTLADIDADSVPEIFVTTKNDGIKIFKADGSQVGAYQNIEGYAFEHTGGAVADLNGDGRLEAVFRADACLGGSCVNQKMVSFLFPGSDVTAYAAPWTMARHDLHRTAWYEYNDPSAFPAPPKGEFLFRRGDANGDGMVDISDPIFILNSLLPGGVQPGCQDAADADDNGQIQTQDAIAALKYMFTGGPEIPSPGPAIPGPDPTADPLGCVQYP